MIDEDEMKIDPERLKTLAERARGFREGKQHLARMALEDDEKFCKQFDMGMDEMDESSAYRNLLKFLKKEAK